LKNAGVRDIITPETGFDSEALFDALCSRPPAPRRVLIVRGQGGREWLGDALRRRGVEVAHLECYRRVVPAGNLDELLPRWRRGDRLAVTATSAEIVANLFSMAGAGGRSWLCRAPFFAVHPRVAAAAFACGVQTLFITGAGDDALALGLQTWFGRLRSARAAA
jgi:uroporphyrinogen-III synthase